MPESDDGTDPKPGEAATEAAMIENEKPHDQGRSDQESILVPFATGTEGGQVRSDIRSRTTTSLTRRIYSDL